MTKREELHVVKPTTSVDDGALFLICCTCLPYFRSVERDHSILLFFAALEMLVKHRISGFPVIDDDWNLVGVVSDYDLLALDTISGAGPAEADIFPEVDSTWKECWWGGFLMSLACSPPRKKIFVAVAVQLLIVAD
uniref:CBS domain-containing protein n=1 Tax=Zea mays TaxID=4577 RepID=A0A804NQ49_MAIZE